MWMFSPHACYLMLSRVLPRAPDITFTSMARRRRKESHQQALTLVPFIKKTKAFLEASPPENFYLWARTVSWQILQQGKLEMCVSDHDTIMISLDNHDSAPGFSTRLPEEIRFHWQERKREEGENGSWVGNEQCSLVFIIYLDNLKKENFVFIVTEKQNYNFCFWCRVLLFCVQW